MASTPLAYPHVLSRCFASSDSASSQVTPISATGSIPGSSTERARATSSGLFSFARPKAMSLRTSDHRFSDDGASRGPYRQGAAGGHWPERAGCLGQCVAGIRLQLDVGCGDVELELLDTGRNVRLSDEQELRILDELRAAGALLLGTGQGAVAALRGASEGLATAAALAPAGDVVLVATDFPSVTHPWLAGSASGRSVTWVEDRASVSLTESVVDAIRPGVAAVCVTICWTRSRRIPVGWGLRTRSPLTLAASRRQELADSSSQRLRMRRRWGSLSRSPG